MELKIYEYASSIPEEYLDQIKLFDVEGINQFFNDPFTFNLGIVLDEDKVVGVGLIRVINEFRMAINQEKSDYIKSKTIKTLLDSAMTLSQCNEIVVEITRGGDHYINILTNHYNFHESLGQVLRLDKGI